MNQAEAKIQADIVAYLRGLGVFCHSVPNEAAGTNPVRQGILVTMGLFPGVADLIVWLPSGIAYVEVKTASGVQSTEQKKFEARCIESGIQYYLARSVDDMRNILEAK